MTVWEQLKKVFVHSCKWTLVHVLTLLEQSLESPKHCLSVSFIERVMLLAKKSQKVLFKWIIYLFHVFIIKKRNFLNKNTEYFPYITYSTSLPYFVNYSQYAIQKPALLADLSRKQVLCYLSDIADKSIFIDMRDTCCLL